MELKCPYCKATFFKEDQAVRHCITEHPNERICFIKVYVNDNLVKYKQKTFHIHGRDVNCDPDDISYNYTTGKLEIPKRPPTDSPVHKMCKTSTPSKSVHKQLVFEVDKESENESCFNPEYDTSLDYNPQDMDVRCVLDIPCSVDAVEDEHILTDEEQLQIAVDKLQKLLPEVTAHLAENGRLSDWISFFSLVRNGDFNVNHIASQLFLDVVRFSTIGNSKGMRYSQEVKEFWAVGQSLFRGKFLRFMGGYKTMFSEDEFSKEKKYTKTDTSMINFVCPDRTVLKEHKNTHALNCENPGIIKCNIDAVADISNADKAYTVCIDGKKITSGFGKYLGEVDLFGNESSPTLEEKKDRLEIETSVIDNVLEEIGKVKEKDVESIDECSQTCKDSMKSHLFDLLSILTERIREMRLLKVSRQLTLEKLQKMAGEVWQKSKYAFAISSIKTQMHTVNLLIQEILDANKKIGLVISACQSSDQNFSLQHVIHLQRQSNFVCLRTNEVEMQSTNIIPDELVKQRSEKWFSERKNVKVTGSTINSAIGLDTLKRQKEHFDKISDAKSSNESSNQTCSSAMQHGIDNEINAVGTLCTIVLPVFAPLASYHEEGFYKVSIKDHKDFLIVSPDGSCRLDDKVNYAIEIKCPMPGKKYTPDVHYSLPKYYVSQCLAEMVALKCQKLIYLSWTPESTTVQEVEFDENLWGAMQDELHALYAGSTIAKPTKKRPAVAILQEAIKEFIQNKVKLIAEFPSNVCIPCHHETMVNSVDEIKSHHGKHELIEEEQVNKERTINNMHTSIDAVLTILTKAKQCIQDAYNVLRLPAKEVIVAILSDLDRSNISAGGIHGIPIAYGLSGYSLKVECMRSLINDVVRSCSEKRINIKALSTDGQFYRMCVRSESGEPLTILQLAKDTWDKARKMTKAEQINFLMNLNFEKHCSLESVRDALDFIIEENENLHCSFPIVVKSWKGKQWPKLYNPRQLRTLINMKDKQAVTVDDESIMSSLSNLPVDALNSLPGQDDTFDSLAEEEEAFNSLKRQEGEGIDENIACKDITSGEQLETEYIDNNGTLLEEKDYDILPDIVFTCSNVDEGHEHLLKIDVQTIPDNVLDSIIHELCVIDRTRKTPKWTRLDRTKLRQFLSKEAKDLFGSFTKMELQKCILLLRDAFERMTIPISEKSSKMEMANVLATLFGKESLLKPRKSPPKLRHILKDYFSRTMGKQALNAIIATRLFLNEDLPAWRKNASFRDGLKVDNRPYVWYCQPEYFKAAGDFIVFLLDCHHLFVNARSYISQNGIRGLDINKEAWIDVVNSFDSSETGLSRAIVVDLIDRQSNAIAQIFFSEEVEQKLRDLKWNNEANFCKCIRNWYKAEDDPGIPQSQRIQMRLEMRNILLNAVNLADFPPPGNNVAGMTMVMFEGILTNIDRRLQLHALVPGHMYNVRAPNTLAVENFFSGFQDLDPKSTGVLLADDIPHALETASYLIKMRLDPNRSFSMRTTRRNPVYPSKPLSSLNESTTSVEGNYGSDQGLLLNNLDSIPIREHPFDSSSRRTKHPKRKKGTVPDYEKPSRGTMPVRQYHKADSSKILPYVRRGLPDSI